jgi:hypothetical protein
LLNTARKLAAHIGQTLAAPARAWLDERRMRRPNRDIDSWATDIRTAPGRDPDLTVERLRLGRASVFNHQAPTWPLTTLAKEATTR